MVQENRKQFSPPDINKIDKAILANAWQKCATLIQSAAVAQKTLELIMRNSAGTYGDSDMSVEMRVELLNSTVHLDLSDSSTKLMEIYLLLGYPESMFQRSTTNLKKKV